MTYSAQLTAQLTARIDALLDRAVDLLAEDIRTQKITKYGAVNASGRLAASLEKHLTENGGQVLIADYVDNVIKGSPPGTVVDESEIEQWIRDKPVAVDDEKAVARRIVRKIFKKGTEVHMQGGSDLFKDTFRIIEEEFIEQATNLYTLEATNQIVNGFK